MKTLIPFILVYFLAVPMDGQTIWKDTLKTEVNLKKFKLSKKTVQAEYGRVIMYFNQADYLKKTVDIDTVRITPKYFSEEVISNLLRSGKVRIIRRSDDSIVTSITHHLQQYGAQCDREFEFEDGEGFFSIMEISGIYGAIVYREPDSVELNQRAKIIPTKDFAYEEEFANYKDTSRIKIKDYLPLNPSTHYVYNNNNGYQELDTNVCKSTSLAKQTVFYFAECYNKYDIVSIGPTMFGPGIYFYKNDSLFAIEAYFEKDIQEKDLKDVGLLFPAFMTPGDSVSVDFGMKKQTFTYLVHEDLITEGKTFKDCIKFKIIDDWTDTTNISYIWLKKNVGLVKWMRSTGRIDELVNQY